LFDNTDAVEVWLKKADSPVPAEWTAAGEAGSGRRYPTAPLITYDYNNWLYWEVGIGRTQRYCEQRLTTKQETTAKGDKADKAYTLKYYRRHCEGAQKSGKVDWQIRNPLLLEMGYVDKDE
jgi:hypothetical protein